MSKNSILRLLLVECNLLLQLTIVGCAISQSSTNFSVSPAVTTTTTTTTTSSSSLSSSLSSSSSSSSSSNVETLLKRQINRHSSVLQRSFPQSNDGNVTFTCASSHLAPNCSCLRRDHVISVNCSRARLYNIPRSLAEIGSTLIKNLTFERNHIRTINDGDFFGLRIERLLLGHNALDRLDFLAFWGLEFNLEALDLSYNRFVAVPTEALRLLRNLRSLGLTGNRIAAVRDYDFGYLRNLEVLALDRNLVESIGPHAFAGTQLYLLNLAQVRANRPVGGLEMLPTKDLEYLKGLFLARNAIERLPSGGWFQNMKVLKYLNLDENGIKDIADSDAFLGLDDTLRTLELRGNRLQVVPVSALSRLHRLESLDLSRNRIRRLHARPFNESRSLVSLDLSGNRIEKVSKKAFSGLRSIRRIDLRHNRIFTLDEQVITLLHPHPPPPHPPSPPRPTTSFYLSGNPWLCNCMIKWLRRDLKSQSGVTRDSSIADAKAMTCDRPEALEATALISVPLKDLSCDHNYYYYYYYDDYNDNNNIIENNNNNNNTR